MLWRRMWPRTRCYGRLVGRWPILSNDDEANLDVWAVPAFSPTLLTVRVPRPLRFLQGAGAWTDRTPALLRSYAWRQNRRRPGTFASPPFRSLPRAQGAGTRR